MKSRALVSFTLFFVIMTFGTLGYMYFGKTSVLESLYMTTITISTVGYREIMPLSPGGKIFTICLIYIGVGFVLYVFSKITEAVVEGGLQETLGRLSMKKKITKLKDHYVVCGFGRIGKVICKIFKENNLNFVVIEKNPRKIETIAELGYLVLEGEASDDDVLREAGVEKAKGLVAVVSSDADNVYTALTARGLNPNLYIMARSSSEEGAETKLLRAGVDKVFSPYFIGATRMAQQLVRPTVTDFVDLAIHDGELGLRLEEILVPPKSELVNKTLFESGIRKNFDIIVVAIKRDHGEMLFNPTPQTEIHAGDILIVLGQHGNIAAMEKEM